MAPSSPSHHWCSSRSAVIILWGLWFFAGGGVHVVSAAPTPSRSECRQQGFDSTQLACTTCAVLPQKLQTACTQCCQHFRDVNRIQKPYEAAVLVVPSSNIRPEEITKLLQDDWDSLVTEKGSHRMKLVEDTNVDTSNQFFFAAAVPAYLYLFDNVSNVPSNKNDKLSLEGSATETILLTGWKREDIRDMLQALLPTA